MKIISTSMKNPLWMFYFAAGLSLAGCSAEADFANGQDEATDEAEQLLEDGNGNGRSADAKPAQPGGGFASCKGCAPPFVERTGEMEFSGRLTVRPRQDIEPGRSKAARERVQGLVKKHYAEVDEYTIELPGALGKGPRGAGENQLAAELMATGDYEYVVPDWRVYPLRSPNDPLFGNQWHHAKIGSPQAWDLLTGTFAGASSITLAFTDTGIDKGHPDLAPNRVAGFNAVSDLAEVAGGDVSDVHGHGTHVAGCAAAIGNNGVGVSGVGWNFKIMMVRVSDASNGGAWVSDITQGARWAADNGAKVVSSSYSGVADPSVGTTGTYIKSRGALYLYAAGNDAADLSGFDHPDVVIVGATDSADNRAWFSNYGIAVDLAAPGVDIWSSTNGGGYAGWNGTSMATPVANGVAGMIWAVNPRFTPNEVENFLLNGTDDIGVIGDDSVFGRGRVNVFKSVQLARAAACSHSQCTTGGPLGNGCGQAVTSVCAVDPYCCSVAWDNLCVGEVQSVANSLTCNIGTCSHALCTQGGTLVAGCDAPPLTTSCVSSICAVDPYCCNAFWDGICVNEVSSVCGKNCN